MYGQTLKNKKKMTTGLLIIATYAVLRLLSDVASKDNNKPTK